ncbi:MAG: GIY-YIG nuclease family protein [Chitinophagaceae bacterium]|nr:GIY-YIG nuclease family protein [Chitinophagaceae bacterium]
MNPSAYFQVYILACADNSFYTGCTANLSARICRHERGEISYTKNRLPVKLIFFCSFPDKYKAFQFEKYLKSGSGTAFRNRHLL